MSYDDEIAVEGIEYKVGTNDGKMFKRAIFIGKKMHNGKEMLCFKMHETSQQLTINPSYMSWIIEDNTEMNEVLYLQGIGAWQNKKAKGVTDGKTLDK